MKKYKTLAELQAALEFDMAALKRVKVIFKDQLELDAPVILSDTDGQAIVDLLQEYCIGIEGVVQTLTRVLQERDSWLSELSIHRRDPTETEGSTTAVMQPIDKSEAEAVIRVTKESYCFPVIDLDPRKHNFNYSADKFDGPCCDCGRPKAEHVDTEAVKVELCP